MSFGSRMIMATGLLVLFLLSCVERRPAQGGNTRREVSTLLDTMIKEDQQLRSDDSIDWARVVEADQRHREMIFEWLAKGEITDPEDLYNAAFLLQHADPATCRECYLLAYQLSTEAVRQGFRSARYLSALNLDRYLVFSGKPQKFGTQYNTDSAGVYYLFPIDSATTDDERAEWDVDPLDTIKARIVGLNHQ